MIRHLVPGLAFAVALAAAPPAGAETLRAGADRMIAALNAHDEGSSLYAPAFKRLEDEDNQRRNARDWDLLDTDWDYDPVCNCQDEGGSFALITATLTSPGQGRIRYRTGGMSPGDAVYRNTLVVTQVRGRWMVSDVISNGKSYRAFLVRHLACLKTSRSANRMNRCMGG